MLSIQKMDDKFYIRYEEGGFVKYYRHHFNSISMAEMVTSIMTDHWMRKITGKEHELETRFVADKAKVTAYNSEL